MRFPFTTFPFKSLWSCGILDHPDVSILTKICPSFRYLHMNHVVSNEVCATRPQCLDGTAFVLLTKRQFASSAHVYLRERR